MTKLNILENMSLEDAIDKHGLIHILTALETICHEKAEHLESNWQDKINARQWTFSAKEIYKLASKLEKNTNII